MTMCVLSKTSRGEQLAFSRSVVQLKYRAYAKTKDDAMQSIVLKETLPHSVGFRN